MSWIAWGAVLTIGWLLGAITVILFLAHLDKRGKAWDHMAKRQELPPDPFDN